MAVCSIFFNMNIHGGGGGGRDTLTSFVFSLLGLQAFYPCKQSWNYPSWSLSVFFVCWIIYFALVYISKDKTTIRMLGTVGMVLLGIGLQMNRFPTEIALFNTSVARGYISFFSGGILYYIQKATGGRKKGSMVGASIILLFLFVLRGLGVPVGLYSVVFGMIVFPAVLLLAIRSRVLQTVLSFSPLSHLGKISFSIYLCNYPIEIFLVLINEWLHLNINFSSVWFFFSYIGIHILVGTVFHEIFEKRVPKYIKRSFFVLKI